MTVEGTLVSHGPTVYLAIAQGEYVIGYTQVFEEVCNGTADSQKLQCVHEISGNINKVFYQDILPALSPLASQASEMPEWCQIVRRRTK